MKRKIPEEVARVMREEGIDPEAPNVGFLEMKAKRDPATGEVVGLCFVGAGDPPAPLRAAVEAAKDGGPVGAVLGGILAALGCKFYDREGKPITFEEAARLRSNPGYFRVGFDHLPWGGEVSTVWLAMADGEDSDGRPLVFETIVFSPETIDENGAPSRAILKQQYATEADALAGHAVAVALYRDGPTAGRSTLPN